MSSSPSTAELTNSLTSKMITKELASYRTTICATIFSNKILLVITQTNAFGSIYHCLIDRMLLSSEERVLERIREREGVS